MEQVECVFQGWSPWVCLHFANRLEPKPCVCNKKKGATSLPPSPHVCTYITHFHCSSIMSQRGDHHVVEMVVGLTLHIYKLVSPSAHHDPSPPMLMKLMLFPVANKTNACFLGLQSLLLLCALSSMCFKLLQFMWGERV
jgi:hypothetical protein